jgi:ATP-binding cassette subfamily C (CFTR/MRP) protein 4
VIFCGSIRENILFGLTMVEERYKDALEFACLGEDLKIMANGDETIVEERATNLSGGQKTRLALARAYYSDR